jgi:hypothetical protein
MKGQYQFRDRASGLALRRGVVRTCPFDQRFHVGRRDALVCGLFYFPIPF